MEYLELSFDDPADNLACDEALMEWFEAQGAGEGLCRLWEPSRHFLVLGYSNRLEAEAKLDACARRAVPIVRRLSGGGAVLQGPGCLNYTLIVRNDPSGPFANIAATFAFVLERHQQFFERLIRRDVRIDGISDLTVDGLKFSGNAQYRKRRYLLVHGTVLLRLDLALVDHCLRQPLRQPPYRRNRPHREFICNLHLDSDAVRRGFRDLWNADREFTAIPYGRIAELKRERYEQAEWTGKF